MKNANPDRRVSAAHDHWQVVDQEIRHVQSLLGVEPDGIIGPLTRKAAGERGGSDTGSNRDVLTAIADLKGIIMSAKDDLKAASDRVLAAVAKNTTVDESVRTLLQGNADQLRAIKAQLDAAIAANDEPGIKAAAELLGAAATQLETDNAATADAVVANTPAENSANG